MNYGFRIVRCDLSRRRPAGFTLMEAVTSLGILAVIVTGVLVTVNRSLAAMVDNRSRVLAFELARENMEKLLGSDYVTDMTEFGVHELDEDIQWQNVVESFHEPVKSAMWVRAVCSASYTDRNGERQTVELTHWITDLSKAQEKQILDQQRREQEFLEEMDGNPFGDDPDGLMQYADALAEMGDYERAAEAASELMLEYPDEPQATAAWPRLLRYPELALSEGNPEAAQVILTRIMEDYGYRPGAQTVHDKLKPIIDSGQPYFGLSGGGRRGTGASEASGNSGAGTAGDAVTPGPDTNTGGTGQESSSPATGSDSGSRYPNPNWTPEQKAIWDMFMNR